MQSPPASSSQTPSVYDMLFQDTYTTDFCIQCPVIEISSF